MRAFVLKRLLWMIPTLLGISFVTFLLIELAPGDPVLAQSMSSEPGVFEIDERVRAERANWLKRQYGLIDEAGHELSFLSRYVRWLGNACALRFAGSSTKSEQFRDRIFRALPITLLLNGLALLLALAIAIPLGVKTGMRPGSTADRVSSGVMFVVYGMPEFLVATLLLLLLCGGVFTILPAGGLRSADVGASGVLGRLFDLGVHLFLPVVTLAIGYAVVLYRFLRESVARASRSEFVLALRAFGASDDVIRRRVLRNGLSPVVTLLGSMLPTLVGGTVVVEKIFALPGIGMLTAESVAARNMPMVLALTMLISIVTLISFLMSDVLQRVVDPRVSLR